MPCTRTVKGRDLPSSPSLIDISETSTESHEAVVPVLNEPSTKIPSRLPVRKPLFKIKSPSVKRIRNSYVLGFFGLDKNIPEAVSTPINPGYWKNNNVTALSLSPVVNVTTCEANFLKSNEASSPRPEALALTPTPSKDIHTLSRESRILRSKTHSLRRYKSLENLRKKGSISSIKTVVENLRRESKRLKKSNKGTSALEDVTNLKSEIIKKVEIDKNTVAALNLIVNRSNSGDFGVSDSPNQQTKKLFKIKLFREADTQTTHSLQAVKLPKSPSENDLVYEIEKPVNLEKDVRASDTIITISSCDTTQNSLQEECTASSIDAPIAVVKLEKKSILQDIVTISSSSCINNLTADNRDCSEAREEQELIESQNVDIIQENQPNLQEKSATPDHVNVTIEDDHSQCSKAIEEEHQAPKSPTTKLQSPDKARQCSVQITKADKETQSSRNISKRDLTQVSEAIPNERSYQLQNNITRNLTLASEPNETTTKFQCRDKARQCSVQITKADKETQSSRNISKQDLTQVSEATPNEGYYQLPSQLQNNITRRNLTLASEPNEINCPSENSIQTADEEPPQLQNNSTSVASQNHSIQDYTQVANVTSSTSKKTKKEKKLIKKCPVPEQDCKGNSSNSMTVDSNDALSTCLSSTSNHDNSNKRKSDEEEIPKKLQKAKRLKKVKQIEFIDTFAEIDESDDSSVIYAKRKPKKNVKVVQLQQYYINGRRSGFIRLLDDAATAPNEESTTSNGRPQRNRRPPKSYVQAAYLGVKDSAKTIKIKVTNKANKKTKNAEESVSFGDSQTTSNIVEVSLQPSSSRMSHKSNSVAHGAVKKTGKNEILDRKEQSISVAETSNCFNNETCNETTVTSTIVNKDSTPSVTINTEQNTGITTKLRGRKGKNLASSIVISPNLEQSNNSIGTSMTLRPRKGRTTMQTLDIVVTPSVPINAEQDSNISEDTRKTKGNKFKKTPEISIIPPDEEPSVPINTRPDSFISGATTTKLKGRKGKNTPELTRDAVISNAEPTTATRLRPRKGRTTMQTLDIVVTPSVPINAEQDSNISEDTRKTKGNKFKKTPEISIIPPDEEPSVPINTRPDSFISGATTTKLKGRKGKNTPELTRDAVISNAEPTTATRLRPLRGRYPNQTPSIAEEDSTVLDESGFKGFDKVDITLVPQDAASYQFQCRRNEAISQIDFANDAESSTPTQNPTNSKRGSRRRRGTANNNMKSLQNITKSADLVYSKPVFDENDTRDMIVHFTAVNVKCLSGFKSHGYIKLRSGVTLLCQPSKIMNHFKLDEGKGFLQIRNETKINLEAGQSFDIPPDCRYEIQNTSNEENLVLYFLQFTSQ